MCYTTLPLLLFLDAQTVPVVVCSYPVKPAPIFFFLLLFILKYLCLRKVAKVVQNFHIPLSPNVNVLHQHSTIIRSKELPLVYYYLPSQEAQC